MEISNVFRNEVAEIETAIAFIPVERCINNYNEYINTNPIGFEADYVHALRSNAVNFSKRLLKARITDKSKEELIDMVINYREQGCYEFNSKCYDEGMEEVIMDLGYTDAEAHKFIIEEMKAVLDELVKKANMTANEQETAIKEQQLKVLKEHKASAEANISKWEKDIEVLEKSLGGNK